MSKDEYQRWVKVTNCDLIKSTQAQHRGILVAGSHTGMVRLTALALARQGIHTTTLEADDYYRNLNLPETSSMKSIEMRSAKGFYLKVLTQASKVLKHSGVLVMAPDGLRGMGEGKKYPFLGKERTFYFGFAALAVKTGAVVMFPHLTIHEDGRVDVDFRECSRTISESHEKVIADLESQYVSFLEHLWRKDITQVVDSHLTSFFLFDPE